MNEESHAQQEHLTEKILEDSVDQALKKADYNWDGYISWDEYVYSLGNEEVKNHEKHDYDRKDEIWEKYWPSSI